MNYFYNLSRVHKGDTSSSFMRQNMFNSVKRYKKNIWEGVSLYTFMSTYTLTTTFR